jgi:hypothetical protein
MKNKNMFWQQEFKGFRCDICGNYFTEMPFLKRHLYVKHRGDRVL